MELPRKVGRINTVITYEQGVAMLQQIIHSGEPLHIFVLITERNVSGEIAILPLSEIVGEVYD